MNCLRTARLRYTGKPGESQPILLEQEHGSFHYRQLGHICRTEDLSSTTVHFMVMQFLLQQLLFCKRPLHSGGGEAWGEETIRVMFP